MPRMQERMRSRSRSRVREEEGGGQLPKDDDLTTDGTTIQSKATVDTKQSNIKSRKKKCLEKKGRIYK